MTAMSDKMFVLQGEGMGTGDPALSRKMMRGFLKVLSKQPVKPKAIFFLGEAVRLAIEDSPVLDMLQSMAGDGVELLICKAAVEWFSLESKLEVGKIITTGRWLELMSQLEVITL